MLSTCSSSLYRLSLTERTPLLTHKPLIDTLLVIDMAARQDLDLLTLCKVLHADPTTLFFRETICPCLCLDGVDLLLGVAAAHLAGPLLHFHDLLIAHLIDIRIDRYR